MGRTELEVVERLQELTAGEDLRGLVDDTAFAAAMAELIDPAAEVRFVDVEGGPLGDAIPSERGIEGLRAGWVEFLEAWGDFRLDFEGLEDAGEGRILSLADLRAKSREGIELSHAGAAVFTVRDGRAVAIDFYMDRDQARRDVGVA
jgi:ketosteroid isomerase-like protein